MIRPVAFDNVAALAVFRDLDPQDRLEAMMARGGSCDHLELWHEWKAGQAWCALSLVLTSAGGTPFAVLAVARVPGVAGLAQAALLARRHDRWRREIAQAAVLIRRDLSRWAGEAGLHRIEARCWAGHPSAAGFLSRCGFTHEGALPGFGPDGGAVFHQFAWTTNREDPSHVHETEDPGNAEAPAGADRGAGQPRQHAAG